MTSRDFEYYSLRERQERDSAARSDDMTARRVHLEMADRYSAMLQELIALSPTAAA